jgi:TolB-like protein
MRIFLWLLILFPVAAYSSPENGTRRPTVAVFDFKSDWSIDYHVQVTDAGRAIAMWLAHDLAVLAPIAVIDRQSVSTLQDHRKFNLGDPVTPSDAKEMGRVLRSDALVTGQVFWKGAEMIVAAKVVSSANGETQGTAVKGGPTTTLADLISQLAEQVGQIVLHQQGVKQSEWEPAKIVRIPETVPATVPGAPDEKIASIAAVDRKLILTGSEPCLIRPGVHDVLIYYDEGNVRLGHSILFDVRPGATYAGVYDAAAAKGKRLWIQDLKTHQPVEFLNASALGYAGPQGSNWNHIFFSEFSEEGPLLGSAGSYPQIGVAPPSGSTGGGGHSSSGSGGHK